MPSPINTALLSLVKRAETNDTEKLVSTFVDVGPLITLLSTNDHQIVFGRRGTGKTHALNYLASQKISEGHVVAEVDLRNVGSNGGMYADEATPLSVRASGLLVDTLSAIHDSLYSYCLQNTKKIDLSQAGPLLDAIADSITEVKVVGNTEIATSTQQKTGSSRSDKLGVSFSGSGLAVQGESGSEAVFSLQSETSRRYAGTEELHVNFGATTKAFSDFLKTLQGARLFVLLDEWSSIPLVLQPYLADLLRRCILPLDCCTVKIAAIEHRTNFRILQGSQNYVGIELGADVIADINLDDFMVFDNDSQRAIEFFETLIGRHAIAAVENTELASSVPTDPKAAFRSAFTEKRAIEEFVRACEGVPRDALCLISIAAQRALNDTISVEDVRIAAKNWYQRDKERAVTDNPQAHDLLHKIIDHVIGKRKARAFLLRSGKKHPLIDGLYDSRILHVLKRAISSRDHPGVRYDVYKIDYGCYVDLLTTKSSPQGLFPLDDKDDSYIEVPPDDYRSIRRAILEID